VIELHNYKVLTFDCYGTLIDWESGMVAALQPILAAHQIHLEDEAIIQLFAEFEAEQEQGTYIKYGEVLNRVVQQFGKRLGFQPSATEVNALADSIKNWQPFPDTIEALKMLKQHLQLAIISNVDDALFADTAKLLQVEFDWVITAEQVKSYKPSLNNFKMAIERMGLPPEKILHVAGSIYHDIVPASSLGLSTVWIDRRGNKDGPGAALPATGQPDLQVPDLKSLADLL
jgi:2-haloacid dehalogenase